MENIAIKILPNTNQYRYIHPCLTFSFEMHEFCIYNPVYYSDSPIKIYILKFNNKLSSLLDPNRYRNFYFYTKI